MLLPHDLLLICAAYFPPYFRMKTCVYGSVCDKIVQGTDSYRKENQPMIRYGAIGTNFIVDRFQEAAMENPSLHYAAVYSRNQETASRFAAKYGVETTYTDLKAFACADNLDAVYIASQTASTMNRSHFSYPMESMCCARSPLPPMPGGESQILYQGPAKSDMSGEIAEWLRLISAGPGSNVHNRYSQMALQVMDEARRQMRVVFPADEM